MSVTRSISSCSSCQDFDACVSYRSHVVAWTSRIQQLAASTASDAADCGSRGCSVRLVDDRHSFRALYTSELQCLQQQGNKVREGGGTRLFLVLPTEQHRLDQSSMLKQVAAGNVLDGTVVFILLSDSDSSTSNGRSMIEGCKIQNSLVHLDAHLEGSSVSHAYIGSKAVVEHSRVLLPSTSSELKQRKLQPPSLVLKCQVGAESLGGRNLSLTAESTMLDVSEQVMKTKRGCATKTKTNDLPQEKKSTAASTTMVVNYLAESSRITSTPHVHRVFLFPNATIQGAASIENATLYPYAQLGPSVIVKNVLLQWHAQIVHASTVQNSLLMEHAAVGPHSVVAESVLGPDAHVSCGEVHASVLGPNVNAHHQSLLISVLWLCGRGNVGYGANVGSNHTGRSPDQEVISGEGVFWGLSVVVKFPVALAPYTIVAAGTVLPPQRVTMPFSLIVTGSNNNYNSIMPGWVLGSSPYTLARTRIKLATRRKAKHHAHYTGWDILRPSLVEQCAQAREELMLSPSHKKKNQEKKKYYQPSSENNDGIPGVGACELSEKARVAGIRAYTDCIQRYALRGLLRYVIKMKTSCTTQSSWRDTLVHEFLVRNSNKDMSSSLTTEAAALTSALGGGVPWEVLPWQEDDPHQVWIYQRNLLRKEFPLVPTATKAADDDIDGHATKILAWIRSLLNDELISLESKYAQQVRECKHRDDVRGEKTISGYAESHVAADQDPVVIQVQRYEKETIEQVHSILHELLLHREEKNHNPQQSSFHTSKL